MATTFHAPDTDRLEQLSDLPTGLALQRSVPLLAHLARDPAFLDAYVLPLLPEACGFGAGDPQPQSSAPIAASLATVLMFRAVPSLAAGIFNLERPILSP